MGAGLDVPTRPFPAWASWPQDGHAWTVGVEEEVMLIDPRRGDLAQVIEEVLVELPERLRANVAAETHASAVEIATRPHDTPGDAVAQLAALRRDLAGALDPLGLRLAAAGTHPTATGSEMRVAEGDRSQLVHASMRELARREPTFALHVHVAVPDPELAISVADRLRAHLPVLLALSANSPFWQGRDSGLASARIPLFQGFPRVGLPRRFSSYEEWAQAVQILIDAGAFPDPTFLWWDVRLQPRLGTVEVRIMDAQTCVDDTCSLVALVQALARLEALEGYAPEPALVAFEVLEENRFLAARDGMEAELVDPVLRRRVPVRRILADLLEAAAPHAAYLGSSSALARAQQLAADPPARRQRELARSGDLSTVISGLSDAFLEGRAALGPRA
jgi:glutamate---cysteine ligase / carboxylate-amine ligase